MVGSAEEGEGKKMIEILEMLLAGAFVILFILFICGVLLRGMLCAVNVLDGDNTLINLIGAIICFLILSLVVGIAIVGV